MAAVFVKTYDLAKMLLSFEKDKLDVVCLEIAEADDDEEYGGPASLQISGVNSRDPEFASEDSIDSDDSLADLF